MPFKAPSKLLLTPEVEGNCFGREFFMRPLQFSSNLDLHIDSGAVIRLLPINQYPGGTQTGTDFISGSKLHDIAITGKGIIDGQGSPWWPFAKEKVLNVPV